MRSYQDAVPFRLYSVLPDGYENPLPAVHRGPVYHYTNLAGAYGMIEAKCAWASHLANLNDPSERTFGWRAIGERVAERSADFTERAARTLALVCELALDPGDRFAQSFVLSGSRESDNLTQFRLYGQCQVQLAGGLWTAARPSEEQNRLHLHAVWRSVLYGRQAALPFIDRMLTAIAEVLRSPRHESLSETEEVYAVMELIEVLALHIKDGAYQDEREVRLVFSLRQKEYMGRSLVRVSGDRLVTYLQARPLPAIDPSMIKSVLLGPLAGGERSAEALRVHHYAQHDVAPSAHVDRRELLEVQLSRTAFSRT